MTELSGRETYNLSKRLYRENTAGQVSTQLAQQAEAVAAHLLPEGQRKISHWVVGSIAGEEGGSLKTALTGEDAGLWVDHADSSQCGDMLDLWGACRGLNTKDALREAKAYLGWQEPAQTGQGYPKPTPPQKPAHSTSDATQKRRKSHDKAQTLWGQGKPAQSHPYTDKKGLKPDGLRVKDGALLIPMYDAAKKLTCIQTINSEPKQGEPAKKFLYGCQAKDCYYPIGKPTDITLIIAEGWATGKSIHLATGLAVAVAFSSGNLSNVARIMREKHPDFEIILAPDNDKNRHAIEIAESAARQHRCQVVVPQFPEGIEGTDFDDLRQGTGLEEVKRQVMDCRYRPIFETVTKTESAIDWPDYPLEALGPVLSEAAQAIANTVQVPAHLAGQTILAATALAVQARANVQIDNRIHPLSLFCLTIGESGERKSGADYQALKPHRDWERQQQKQAGAEFEAYRNELDTWKRDRSLALKKGGRGLDGFRPEPVKPLQPVFICEEPTLEGLQKSFRFGLASQGLYSDEGGQFFGGHAMNPDNAMKTMAGLSKLWDGAPIKRTRAANGESWAGYHRRLSCHLLTQPIVAKDVLADPLMQQQGILARFLITSGNHLFGKRPYKKPCPDDLATIARYHAAIDRLLADPWSTTEDGALELTTIRPTEAALALWAQAYNLIEAETADAGDYRTIRAAASKSAENIARMAGVMAIFSGQTEISAETMENAITLADYYLEQYLRHIHAGKRFVILDQTKRLLEWLNSQGKGEIKIDWISKNAPTETGVRGSVDNVRAVMQRLVDSGAVRVATVNNVHLPSAWKLL